MSRRLLIAALLLASGPARADEPWSKGVSAEHKAAAKRLLEEGNALFLANRHKEALAKYEAAIAEWDHPAIRFNMVRALVALDRPIEALDNLDKALAYGASPLEDTVYAEALNYQKLLAAQVGHVDVSCDQAGVIVQIDGDRVLACPGTASVKKTPGRHVVIGTGGGLATQTADVALFGGKHEPVKIHLGEPSFATGPRWARWKPWTVIAGGAVVLGAGVAFRVVAKSNADDLDRRSIASCPSGCSGAEYRALGLADLEDRVHRDSKLAVAGIAVGGAALLVGGALLALNHRVYERAPAVMVSADGAVVGVTGRF